MTVVVVPWQDAVDRDFVTASGNRLEPAAAAIVNGRQESRTIDPHINLGGIRGQMADPDGGIGRAAVIITPHRLPGLIPWQWLHNAETISFDQSPFGKWPE